MDAYHLRLIKSLTQKALKSWESITYDYLAVLLYCKHLLLVTVKGRTLKEISMWLDCYDLSYCYYGITGSASVVPCYLSICDLI